MKINRFLLPQDQTRPFHTSGYARVAQGSKMGATSNETFKQRLIREHRGFRSVGRYSDSLLAQGYNERPKVSPVPRMPLKPAITTPTRLNTPGKPTPPIRFVEPPIRNKDPYR